MQPALTAGVFPHSRLAGAALWVTGCDGTNFSKLILKMQQHTKDFFCFSLVGRKTSMRFPSVSMFSSLSKISAACLHMFKLVC